MPVFLVAHKLRTVIDYDCFIVLDKGEVRVMISDVHSPAQLKSRGYGSAW